MIQLTRLNNSQVVINSDLIKFVEQSPDTVITLLSGEKILVQEPVREIIDRVIQFRRQLFAGLARNNARVDAFPPLPIAAGLEIGNEGK